tara:strand:- start:789 stop:1469 length:681 start_codon:yes stop_codon:yes gene_type:complete
MNNLIKINNLNKKYNLSNSEYLLILENLNLNIIQNSITSITGPSGCGKSTLLNIIGLLDSSYVGSYIFNDKVISNLSNISLSNIRNQNIGFIHQFFHLIPELSVFENIMLPALINNSNVPMITNEVNKLLQTFEIFDKKNMKPNKLSGGEQQRIAIARALINKPNLILADEMTGNLDEKTADEIFSFFLNFIKNNNISLIYVTHNLKYSVMADTQYELKNKTLLVK